MSDELMELGKEFEWVSRWRKGGNIYTSVCIYGGGEHASVHVNNPPSDSGFIDGQTMTANEFKQKAKPYIDKVKSY